MQRGGQETHRVRGPRPPAPAAHTVQHRARHTTRRLAPLLPYRASGLGAAAAGASPEREVLTVVSTRPSRPAMQWK